MPINHISSPVEVYFCQCISNYIEKVAYNNVKFTQNYDRNISKINVLKMYLRIMRCCL